MLTPGGAALKGAKVLSRSAKARRLANEIYMNSLFSGPATHATNITANSLVSAWIVPERFLAASADALRYGVTLGKTQREIYFGESGAMAFGMMSSLTDAIRERLLAFRTGQSKIGRSIMEEVAPLAPKAQFRYGPEGLRRIEAEETFVGEGLGFWSTLWRSPTRALGAEDAFFKTINYNAEAYAIAYREAARSGDLSVANIKRFLDNPFSEAVTRAREFAVITTFQREIDELGGGFISKVGGVGQAIQDMPMGRVLAPVLRTPTNLAHFATERTPVLGMLSRTWRADIAAGGARRANAIAKQAGGATLAASFAYFGMSDIVTGGGPTDPTLRRNLAELTGWQPYSIRIGDTYYSYDRLEPLGAMLGLMADFTEIAGQLPSWQGTELGQAVGLAVSRNLMDGRFLDGLTDVFDALAGDSHALERLGKGILQRTTPGGGALRAVTKAIDPVRRETDPGANPRKK